MMFRWLSNTEFRLNPSRGGPRKNLKKQTLDTVVYRSNKYWLNGPLCNCTHRHRVRIAVRNMNLNKIGSESNKRIILVPYAEAGPKSVMRSPKASSMSESSSSSIVEAEDLTEPDRS